MLLGMVGSARAEIYRWVDDEGRTRFSDSLEAVPPEHRDEVQAMGESLEGSPAVTIEPQPPAKAEPLFGRAGGTRRSPDLPALMESDFVRAERFIERYQRGEIGIRACIAGIRGIGGSIGRVVLLSSLAGLAFLTAAMSITLRWACKLLRIEAPDRIEALWIATVIVIAQVGVSLLVPGTALHALAGGGVGIPHLAESLLGISLTVLILRVAVADRLSRAIGLSLAMTVLPLAIVGMLSWKLGRIVGAG